MFLAGSGIIFTIPIYLLLKKIPSIIAHAHWFVVAAIIIATILAALIFVPK
jgi:hypothetical protein